MLPKSDINFESYQHQKQLLENATKEGVYIRIQTLVDIDVDFTLFDRNGDIPLIKDKRKQMEIEFISPHFNPWDELFIPQEDGNWKLNWQWRISDIDGLIADGWNRSLE